MLRIQPGSDRCGRCGGDAERLGFAIEDERGYRVFFCRFHLIQELEVSLLEHRAARAAVAQCDQVQRPEEVLVGQ